LEADMWREYITVSNVEGAINILAERGPSSRIIAGATDLMLEIENGTRADIDTLIDITRIDELNRIILDEDDVIHLGPLVTHNQCVDSKLIVEQAFPLAQAAWDVGAPQIRNRGTIAGNLITASPANDTITPLMALDAKVTLRSTSGERIVPLDEFFTGVRETVMKSDEMLVDISFPALDSQNQQGAFAKLGLREAQAIAVVNLAVVLTKESDKVSAAAITMGSVAPTVIHAVEAEKYLVGHTLDEKSISQVADLTMEASKPIDDVRASAAYRKKMVRVLTNRLLETLLEGGERDHFPSKPILLAGDGEPYAFDEQITHQNGDPIQTTVNGTPYTVTGAGHKSLLRMLREDLHLVGSKEGCAEGECGACTVILDGSAIMSCLVPAPRAHRAVIQTIEGVAEGDELHPVQETFIHDGAVQCGYCTPGMIMSAVKLLEEKSEPTTDEIKYAIAGNLCRCTGYHKIIQAIENAAD